MRILIDSKGLRHVLLVRGESYAPRCESYVRVTISTQERGAHDPEQSAPALRLFLQKTLVQKEPTYRTMA